MTSETARQIIEKLGLEVVESSDADYEDLARERDEIAQQAWNMIGMILQANGHHCELLDERTKALIDIGVMCGMSAVTMHVTEKYLKGDGNE